MSKPTLRRKPTFKSGNNSFKLEPELYLNNTQGSFKRAASGNISFQSSSKRHSFSSKKII